jgi:hypothetical protein
MTMSDDTKSGSNETPSDQPIAHLEGPGPTAPKPAPEPVADRAPSQPRDDAGRFCCVGEPNRGLTSYEFARSCPLAPDFVVFFEGCA